MGYYKVARTDMDFMFDYQEKYFTSAKSNMFEMDLLK